MLEKVRIFKMRSEGGRAKLRCVQAAVVGAIRQISVACLEMRNRYGLSSYVGAYMAQIRVRSTLVYVDKNGR